MHEDEEMKVQCFGGDYLGEIYDNNLKRMQYRRQKRWWNAYMLFYTRCDQNPTNFEPSVEQLSLTESRNGVLPLPKPIERSVRWVYLLNNYVSNHNQCRSSISDIKIFVSCIHAAFSRSSFLILLKS